MKKYTVCKASALVLGSALGLIPQSHGDVVTLDAVNSGKYYVSGTISANKGISTREGVYRSFLGFDLSSIEGEIVGATLEIGSKVGNQSGQLVNLWDVTTPYTNLGTSSAATYADLGSGILYGSGVHTGGTINSFTLNNDALNSLNLTDSMWAVGIQAFGTSYAFGLTWGITEGDYLKLKLDVAEPEVVQEQSLRLAVPEGGSTSLLMGLSLLGLIGFKRFAKAS